MDRLRTIIIIIIIYYGLYFVAYNFKGTHP